MKCLNLSLRRHQRILSHWLSCIAFFLGLVLMGQQQARAETVYSWQDGSGRTNFGSKPPADARNVQPLSSNRVSRYSSDKVISRFRLGVPDTALHEETIALEPLAQEPESDTALQAASPRMTQNDKKEITACSVVVKNTSTEVVANISVAFEFPDGTFVPGLGPSSIAAQQEATYEVAANQLPLAVVLPVGSDGDVEDIKPEVRIRIHPNG